MRKNLKTGSRGFTFVELLFAITIATIVVLFSYKAVTNMSKATVSANSIIDIGSALEYAIAQLRQEAITNFDAMTATDRQIVFPEGAIIPDTSPTAHAKTPYDNITCLADIAPPGNDRARHVSLKFTYTADGSKRTITRDIILIQERGKQVGANVTVCAQDKLTSYPVGGVRFSMPGQDLPAVTGTSDFATGCVTVRGVKLGTNVNITVDGEPARYYFKTATPNPTFKQTFPLADTNSGTLNLSATPYKLDPPGKVVVNVTDPSLSDQPVLGVQLGLLYRAASLEIPGITITYGYASDASGNYTFNGVIPGTNYCVYMYGLDPAKAFAAVAKVGDRWDQANSPVKFAVTSGVVKSVSFKTVKKGSISGSVTSITTNGDGATAKFQDRVSPTSPLPFPNNLQLQVMQSPNPLAPSKTYITPSALENVFDFSVTGAWSKLSGQTFTNKVTVGPSGAYTLASCGPLILQQDHSANPMENQYARFNIRPITTTPPPFLPIVFVPPGGGSPYDPAACSLLYNYGSGPVLHGAGASSVFDSKVYSIISNTVNTRLLHREALGNVTGSIVNESDLSPFDSSGFTQNLVRIGYDFSSTLAVSFNANETARINVNFYTGITGGNLFNFKEWPAKSFNNIIPTVGTEKLLIQYMGSGAPTQPATPWKGGFWGYTKIKSGQTISYKQVSLDSNNFLIKAFTGKGAPPYWTSDTPIASNGFVISKPAVRMSQYVGLSDPLTLMPGQILTDVKIKVKPAATKYGNYYLAVFPTADQNYTFNWDSSASTPGPVYSYKENIGKYTGLDLSVVEIGTGRIFGAVRNMAGELLTSGTVKLTLSGVPTATPALSKTFTVNLQANACPNCDQSGGPINYVFGDPARFKFLLTSGKNFTLDVSAAGYVAFSGQLDGYKDYDERIDFRLLVNPPPGGNYGNSGGL